MGRARKLMVKYLLRETRYTEKELNKLSDAKIEKWYIEERQCNSNK